MAKQNGSLVRPHGTRLEQIFGGIGADFIKEPPFEGIVSKAPAADGDDCFAQVHVGDSIDELGPLPYMTRGTTLPKPGNRCLIVYSELGQPWIVAWWPHA